MTPLLLIYHRAFSEAKEKYIDARQYNTEEVRIMVEKRRVLVVELACEGKETLKVTINNPATDLTELQQGFDDMVADSILAKHTKSGAKLATATNKAYLSIQQEEEVSLA